MKRLYISQTPSAVPWHHALIQCINISMVKCINMHIKWNKDILLWVRPGFATKWLCTKLTTEFIFTASGTWELWVRDSSILVFLFYRLETDVQGDEDILTAGNRAVIETQTFLNLEPLFLRGVTLFPSISLGLLSNFVCLYPHYSNPVTLFSVLLTFPL